MPSKRDRRRFLQFDYRAYVSRKQFFRFCGFLTLLWIVNVFFIGNQSAIALLEQRADHRSLETDIAHAEAVVDSLEQLALDLEADADAIERFAREEYRMHKKDERQYVFVPVPIDQRERIVEEVVEERRLEAEELEARALEEGGAEGAPTDSP